MAHGNLPIALARSDSCERPVERNAGALQTNPRGVLRITAPVSFGIPHLAPAIVDYMARYPDVSIDMVLNDRTVDLIEEGFDLAIRIGHLIDSTLIARRIAPIRFALCAAPSYLQCHGEPRRPADLARHNCLEFSYRQTGTEWHFIGPDGTKESVRVSGRLKVNNPQVLHTAALNGDGVEFDPTFIVGADIAAGRLVELMPNYRPIETDLSVVYPPGRQLSAKVRSFVDFLATRFTGEPKWDRWRGPPPR
jgi:DNA-binding transcriptional LysR family regulator